MSPSEERVVDSQDLSASGLSDIPEPSPLGLGIALDASLRVEFEDKIQGSSGCREKASHIVIVYEANSQTERISTCIHVPRTHLPNESFSEDQNDAQKMNDNKQRVLRA